MAICKCLCDLVKTIFSKTAKLPILTSFFLILIGTAIALSALYWKSLVPTPSDLNRLSMSFLELLGFTLLTSGIFTFLLHLPDWRHYFEERLKEIVMNQSYLNNLREDELNKIQVSTLKSLYKNTDIERDGSFLQYLQTRIQHHVNSPYREHVNYFVDIKEDKDNNNCFIFNDILSYTCRMIGGKTTEDVLFKFKNDASIELIDMSLKIHCPKCINKTECNSCAKTSECKNGDFILNKETLQTKHPLSDSGYTGFQLHIKDYVTEQDEVQIELLSTFRDNINGLNSWVMTHPSKDITVQITYPSNYKILTFIGGLEKNEFSENYISDMYSFRREGWLLPRAGIAYMLKLKDVPN